MKTCGNCNNITVCDCEQHGYCDMQKCFYALDADADDCESYDGPEDTPEPHYQSEYERDNPRDPIVEANLPF